MRPELVLFDCDGVLVDSERITVAVEARVLTSLGWPITPDEVVRRWMGRTGSAQVAEVAERLGPDAAERYDAESTAEVHRAFTTGLTEVDGISTLVDHLEEARVPICVASSGTHARMAATLGITGLRDRFDGRIFSASEVGRGKPAPDLFLHAASRMGARPAGCVVIEDSPFGVRAGVSAGMRVLGYGGGLVAADVLAEAGAEVFGHMSEVPALLGL